MRIYLIRHGETDHNRDRILQGHGEVPLNAAGIAQTARLAGRLQDCGVDCIYSSDLRRAAMTAAIIAAYTGAPIVYDSGLRERNPGALAGKTYEEGAAFFRDPAYEPPGGESRAVFEARVGDSFRALATREAGRGRTLAVVSHGMVCETFPRICAGWTPKELAKVRWRNASVTIAEYNGHWKILALGDDSHLDEPCEEEPFPAGA